MMKILTWSLECTVHSNHHFVVQDQFDTIDMSDNEIRKVDGFPLLKRLKTLFLNNNRIV